MNILNYLYEHAQQSGMLDTDKLATEADKEELRRRFCNYADGCGGFMPFDSQCTPLNKSKCPWYQKYERQTRLAHEILQEVSQVPNGVGACDESVLNRCRGKT